MEKQCFSVTILRQRLFCQVFFTALWKAARTGITDLKWHHFFEYCAMWHWQMLLSFAQAREGVPFSSIAELVLLELSFELIREAGVRIPGALGNAMGIVGGLIVGSAAVEANLVSPIVVMVVAITALGSLAIPNEEFASAFRMLKYFFLFLGGYLGIFGIVTGVYLTVSHLAGLLSFGVPYLTPFVKQSTDNGTGSKIVRVPFKKRWRRPPYARKNERVRLQKIRNKNRKER